MVNVDGALIHGAPPTGGCFGSCLLTEYLAGLVNTHLLMNFRPDIIKHWREGHDMPNALNPTPEAEVWEEVMLYVSRQCNEAKKHIREDFEKDLKAPFIIDLPLLNVRCWKDGIDKLASTFWLSETRC